jgi:hypothetical protein
MWRMQEGVQTWLACSSALAAHWFTLGLAGYAIENEANKCHFTRRRASKCLKISNSAEFGSYRTQYGYD